MSIRTRVHLGVSPTGGIVAALLPVLALELGNEASNSTRYYVAGWPWGPGSTLVDIPLTMAARS